MKRPIVQAVVLVLASLVLAITANALASRQRKVALVGWYPNATTVAARTEGSQLAARSSQPVAAPAPVPMPATTTTTTAEAAVATQPQPVAPANVGRASARPDGLKPVLHTATANSQPPTVNKPDLSKFTQHPDKPYIEVAFDDVNALHAKGVLFLDARRTSVYEQGHIAGARPFSVWESDIDDKTRKLFDERSDPDAQALPIVVYCSGGDCEDSHMLAQKLWGIQFNNVYVYKDGFPDWQKRGGAVRTGAQP
jgi:rhodanese-related sulfurtransferase